MMRARTLAPILAAGAALALASCQTAGAPGLAEATRPLPANIGGEACRAERYTHSLAIFCGEWEDPTGEVYALGDMSADAFAAAACAEGVEAWRALDAPLSGREALCTGGTRSVVALDGAPAVAGFAYPGDRPALFAALSLAAANPPRQEATIASVTLASREALSWRRQAMSGDFDTLRQRATSENASFNFRAAERSLVEALDLVENASAGDPALRADLLGELAVAYIAQERMDEAATLLAEAERFASEVGGPTLARVRLYQAFERLSAGDPQGALERSQEAGDLAAQQRGAAAGAELQGRALAETISPADARLIEGLRALEDRPVLATVSAAEEEALQAALIAGHAEYVSANAQAALGQDAAALASLDRSAATLPRSAAQTQLLRALSAEDRGRLLLREGRPAEAFAAYDSGLAGLDPQLFNSKAQANLLAGRATAALQLGRAAAAYQDVLAAAEIVTRLDEDPGFSLAETEPLWAAMAAQPGQPDELAEAAIFALSASVEGAAARRTSSLLAERLAAGSGSGAVADFQNAERQLRSAQSRMARLAALGELPPGEAQQLQETIDDLSARYDAAETAMRAAAPDYYLIKREAVTAVSVARALSQSADPAAYVKLMAGASGGYAVVVYPDASVRLSRLDITASEAAELTEDLSRSFRYNSARNAPAPFNVAASCGLSEKLFGPVRPSLQAASVSRLVIEGDESLSAVPFATLLIDDGVCASGGAGGDFSQAAFLGDAFALSTASGAKAFAVSSTQASTASRGSFIGFGGFVPATDTREAVTERILAGSGLPADPCAQLSVPLVALAGQGLEATSAEVMAAAEAFGAGAVAELGEEFTPEAFAEADLGQYDVMLVAAHSYFPPGRARACYPEPALVASQGESGQMLIRASDIVDRRLNARLVVLSACETAREGFGEFAATGLEESGMMLGGLAQAFIFAGARNVAVSYWLISDVETSELNSAFMQNVADGMPLAEALAGAQRALKSDPDTSHPYFWAALALHGALDAPASAQVAEGAAGGTAPSGI